MSFSKATDILIDAYKRNKTPSNTWMDGISDDDYHKSKTAVSSTPLKSALVSGEDFKWSFSFPKTPTKPMVFGTLAHRAILKPETFWRSLAVMPDFGDLRTKLAKEKKALWEMDNVGKTLMDQESYDSLRYMIDSLSSHPDAVLALKHAQTELAGFYTDPETGIPLKIKPDAFTPAANCLADLKTCNNAKERPFKAKIWDFRYDLSMAMYAEGIKAITGKAVEDHLFIALQSGPPYTCAVYVMNEVSLKKAREDYRLALTNLHGWLETGQFPRYQERALLIDLPKYAYSPDEEKVFA